MKDQIEKKAIEEMAKVIEVTEQIARDAHCGYPSPRMIATDLYEKGWRKQSEGEWIEHDDDWCGTFYTCSACGCDWTTIDGTPQENNMRFCPECGAKMKGGAE